MGGSAFSGGDHPLYTPRMPKAVYERTKQRCHDLLKALYDLVDSPIEGPGKKDFGDIDILVATPKNDAVQQDSTAAMAAIQAALGATRVILNKGEGRGSAHMALPWPADMLSAIPPSPQEAPANPPAAYIQVDVRICRTSERLNWILHKHAHGDMWNILGSIIRPYGLTVDEEAMYIRVPEIENFNRKRARIFLTADPTATIEFLGLPPEPFTTPFESLDAMYEYAALCRFFWVRPAPSSAESEGIVDGDDATAEAQARKHGIEEDRQKLKSNDRRRISYRPAFRRWLEEFLPQCREEGRFLAEPTAREAVQEEALDRFGAREAFVRQREDFFMERETDAVRKLIKDAVPAEPEGAPSALELAQHNTFRGVVLKGLRELILNDNRELREKWAVEGGSFKDETGHWIFENVTAFIAKNLDAVAKHAMAENREGL
jgi:hypothetical protein